MQDLFSDKTMYTFAGLFVFVTLCMLMFLSSESKQISRDQHFNTCIKNHSVTECRPLLKD